MCDELDNLKKEILKLSNNKAEKICIFGTGAYGNKLYYDLNSKLIKVDYFSDNDSNKWGYIFDNIMCISPKELEEEKDKILIIVSMQSSTEVVRQLKQRGFKYIVNNETVYNILHKVSLNNLELEGILEIDYSSKTVIGLISKVNEIIADIYKYYNSQI